MGVYVIGISKGWILVGAAANGCNGRGSGRSDSRPSRRDPANCGPTPPSLEADGQRRYRAATVIRDMNIARNRSPRRGDERAEIGS